jgi:2-aminoadipate transaminase
MIKAIERYFPPGVQFTTPQGGMFLWITLPQGLSSLELFGLAIKEKVAFVPGTPFYVDGGGQDCLRLNFSNADEDQIETGMQRLGLALEGLMTEDRERKIEDRMI